MKPAAVVVRSENRVIGVANRLPWHQSEDLKFFKRTTTGHHVIMGRKTFDSIRKPLSNRVNVVMTSGAGVFPEGVLIARSVDEALELCRADDEPMIVGGEQIYRLFLPQTQRIYETILHVELPGDAHFPTIDDSEWLVTNESERFPANAKNDHPFTFRTLDRK